MRQLIVNAPDGVQRLLEVEVPDDQPAYFDYSLVVWDTATDGALPEGVQVGGMVLQEGGALAFDQARMDATEQALAPMPPRVVTMRQARLALRASGMLAAVEAAIDALPEPNRTDARIEWEYSSDVYRDKALVQALAPALGLDEAGLDSLFAQAAGIE